MSGSPVPGVGPIVPMDVSSAPVSAVVVDRRSGESLLWELNAEMSTITNRITPLHWPEPSGNAELVEQVVIRSPTWHETSGGAQPVQSPLADVSFLKSSPDRGSGNLDSGTLDVFLVFPVSPQTDGYAPQVSPVTTSDSSADQSLGSLLDYMAGLYSSIIGSPVTSLSITGRAEDLYLLSLPLIPLQAGESTDLVPMRELTPEVVPSSVAVSQEGSFDVASKPVATSDQPRITTGLSDCPYRTTTSQEWDMACIDSVLGVQVHHPRFLESVGAPESARMVSVDGPT